MMPSGHKAFVVNNGRLHIDCRSNCEQQLTTSVADVDLLLMHNSTFAAEYVGPTTPCTTRPANQL